MSRSNDNWVQKIWYGGSPLRWLLLPFTWLYAAVIACRRGLYASGILRSQRATAPVVIVGNIAAGGTGKTPLAIWLAQQLAARGYKPGIISRGYRGMVGPKPMQATADSDPAVVGDEAIFIVNRSECPVVVHPDRVAAAKLAIEARWSCIRIVSQPRNLLLSSAQMSSCPTMVCSIIGSRAITKLQWWTARVNTAMGNYCRPDH
jgi:tetraacyldisaccharide-1-P 4'-kinase